MWSSARPEFRSHLVMYGTVGWSVGTADLYGGCVLVIWCMSRCLGVGIGSVPMVCCVSSVDCAWKSPKIMNAVSGYLFDIVLMALVTGSMQE